MPKEATPAYQKVLLYIDSATSQVRRVLILDAQGNRNRFDFNNPLVNTPVPARLFHVHAPGRHADRQTVTTGAASRHVMRAAATALFATAMGFVARTTNAAPDAGTVAPASPSPAQIVSSVQAFDGQMKTFNSDFKQQFVNKLYSKTQTRQGRVFFEKPGKMSWRYSAGDRVVSDGQDLKMYEPSNQQVIVHSLSGTQYPAALSFLTGQGNLGQSFNFVWSIQPSPLQERGFWKGLRCHQLVATRR